MHDHPPSPRGLGDPLDAEPAPADKTTDHAPRQSPREPAERAGDTGLGIPRLESDHRRTLSEAETEKHRARREAELRHEAEKLAAELEEAEHWKIPAPIRKAYSLILITVAGVLGLFITNQTIQFIQSLDTLPAWSQKIALGCITLFGLLLLYVIWQLFRNVVRLKRSPGIHRKAIRQLEQRQELQKLAREKHTAARTALIKYLKDYPTTARAEQTCRKAGMRPDEWKQITKAKAALTSNDHAASPDDWVDSFVQSFQTVLTTVARRRVSTYAKRIGLGTAASPIPFIDQMIMLQGSLSMIRELCVLFNLRPAFGQTATILAKSILMTYLSGTLQEGTEEAGSWLSDTFNGDTATAATEGTAAEAGASVGENGLSIFGGSLLKSIGAKGSEGALNAWLIYRLGKRSTQLLQPVR